MHWTAAFMLWDKKSEASYDERLIPVKSKCISCLPFQSKNAFSALVSGALGLAVTFWILMPAMRTYRAASPAHLSICWRLFFMFIEGLCKSNKIMFDIYHRKHYGWLRTKRERLQPWNNFSRQNKTLLFFMPDVDNPIFQMLFSHLIC